MPAIGPSGASSFYYMGLALALVTILAAFGIFHSKFGAGLFAIHDDEDVAEVLGVPTFRYKLAAFAVSCGLAGVAGGIHALFVSYVTAGETFSIIVPLTVVLMSVLGGTRVLGGAGGQARRSSQLCSMPFTAGNHAVAGKAVFGAVLIAVILFMPQRRAGLVCRSPQASGTRARMQRGSAAGMRCRPKRPLLATSEPMLIARGLRRGLSRRTGVGRHRYRLSVAAKSWDCCGPNGSGKSTLHQSGERPLPPDAGTIEFEGRELADCDAHAIARGGIARTYQIPRPFAHLTVRENVAIAAMFGERESVARRLLNTKRGAGSISPVWSERPMRCRTISICISANSSNSRGRWRRGRDWCCLTRSCRA